MKIPKKLWIDGEEWEINLDDSGGTVLDTRNFGMTNIATRKITVDSKQRTGPSFLHEIFHAIDVNRHLEITEQQIDSLAHGLYAVIVDNNLDFREPKKKRKITI